MYSRFGPSARDVFTSDPMQRLSNVESALSRISEPSQLFPVGLRWDESIGDALLVLEPLSDSRGLAVGRIATPYIMDHAMAQAKVAMGARMRETYLDFLDNTVLKDTAGTIFEMLSHRVLGSYKSPLSLTLLSSADSASAAQISLDFEMTSPPVFLENTQIHRNIKPRTYYRILQPAHAGVNAFMIIGDTLVYLQSTGSLQRPVAFKDLSLIRKLVPAKHRKQCKLVFGVPSETVSNFRRTRQSITPPSSRQRWSDNVPQFVVSLSAEELFRQ